MGVRGVVGDKGRLSVVKVDPSESRRARHVISGLLIPGPEGHHPRSVQEQPRVSIIFLFYTANSPSWSGNYIHD